MSQVKFQYLPVAELLAYDKNPMIHPEPQIRELAEGIKLYGFNNPIVLDAARTIIAGHGRLQAAMRLGMKEVPTVQVEHLTPEQVRAFRIFDNKISRKSVFDMEALRLEVLDLAEVGFDLESTGFTELELDGLMSGELRDVFGDGQPQTVEVTSHQRVLKKEQFTDPDEVPEEPVKPVSVAGDVWVMGSHRLMCGDSTSAEHAAILMGGVVSTLLHADPPYGMGKESDGVLNDNIYGENLDAFQMRWWNVFRPYLVSNASAYIWGNAPELWRLWYCGGLAHSEKLEIRNEIVWDKKAVPGMAWDGATQYPLASERCLFFQFGDQFLRSVNADDFPEEWAHVLSYFEDEAQKAQITPSDVKRICGVGMFSHWFTRSQFTLVPEKHYATLASAYPGRFLHPWHELKAEWDEVKTGPRSAFNRLRSYFDNSHDAMRDVWEFPRVVGEDRYGHATPKPVAMMERAINSSSRSGDVVIEPFGGSGSTLIACEKTDRHCRMMELDPKYVDVIVNRWQNFTGKQAVHADTGLSFDQMAEQRRK